MGMLLGGFVLPDGKGGGGIAPAGPWAFSGAGTFEELYGTPSHTLNMPARSAGDLLVVFQSTRHGGHRFFASPGWDSSPSDVIEVVSSSNTTDGAVVLIMKLATADADDEFPTGSFVELDGITPDGRVGFAQMACFSGRPRLDFTEPNSIISGGSTPNIAESVVADFPTAELVVSRTYTCQLLAGGKYLSGSASADPMAAPSGFTMIGSGFSENLIDEALLSGWAYRIVIDGTSDNVPASNWGASSESGAVNFIGLALASQNSFGL